MTFDKFEYVIAVAEERNMHRAAKKLYVSQPGLTAHINKLEQQLGVKLFDRSVSPIQITEAGALYISKMKQLKKEETQLRSALRDLGSPKRIFRIGMGQTRGVQWLPLLLPEFQRRHPDVIIHIQGGGLKDLEDGIADGQLDVAFGALTESYPDLSYVHIRDEIIYCVIPRTFSCVQDIPSKQTTIYHPYLINTSALQGIPFLMPDATNGFYNFTDQLLQKYGIRPSECISMGNLDTAYQLAAQGCGALIINAFDFHRTHPTLDLKLAFCILSDPPITRTSKMAYKPNLLNDDLIEDLLDVIKHHLLPVLNEGLPSF